MPTQKVNDYIKDVLLLTIEEFKEKYSAENFLVSYGLRTREEANIADRTLVDKPDKDKPRWVLDREDLVYPVDLSKGWAWIGRTPNCQVFIPESNISKLHARLVKFDNRLLINDAGSKNGTYLEGKLVSAPTEVNDGDIIGFSSRQYAIYRKGSFYLAVKTSFRIKR